MSFEWCFGLLHTQTKHHETMQENTRHLWGVGLAGLGCECWWLHLDTRAPCVSSLPCLAPSELNWPEQHLVGEEALIEAWLTVIQGKKSRLNTSAHQIGSSLVCLTPGQCSDQEALRGPPCSSRPASLSGLPWQSVVETHVLPWDILIQLKMLPAEKSLLALLGRQWIGGYWEIFIRISLINLS